MANPTKPLGTNSAPAVLTLVKILDLVLKAFVLELLPLRAFSTVISGEVLQGVKTVEVPYIPVDASVPADFNAANGDCYSTGDTTVLNKEVTINKRKYLAWGRTSEEIVNGSYAANLDWASQKGRTLAQAVLQDILSNLSDPNKFPHEYVVGPASTFDADEALEVREKCNLLHMPKTPRSLLLEPSYETGILKYLKPFSVSGDSNALREGQVGRIAGFDEYATECLPTTQNLVGTAIYPSALLVAMRPLEPLPSVKAILTAYEVLTDPDTGITITYRKWADPDCDREKEIVEVNYGYTVGEVAAVLRLLSAALG